MCQVCAQTTVLENPQSSVYRTWEAAISVPAPVGYAHPPEPQCTYDPVEGLNLAPDVDPLDKIRQLEEQISKYTVRLL